MSEEICKLCGKLSTPWVWKEELNGHICEGCSLENMRPSIEQFLNIELPNNSIVIDQMIHNNYWILILKNEIDGTIPYAVNLITKEHGIMKIKDMKKEQSPVERPNE